MASRGQLTGMQGVFLVAAELSARGLRVSTTSRNAMGADLLVTDAACQRTWSVQVKTDRKSAGFWLVGEKAKRLVAPSTQYVASGEPSGHSASEGALGGVSAAGIRNHD